jgi:hypothetical protein
MIRLVLTEDKNSAEKAATERAQTAYSVDRWVVIQQEGPWKDAVGKITAVQNDESFTVTLYGERAGEAKNGISFRKEELRPVQEYKTTRMSADGSSPEMLDKSGQVLPCYAWWGSEQQQKLETHIKEIDKYIFWNYKNEKPVIPEWYLFSLRTHLRRWGGFLPPDYAVLPIQDYNTGSKVIQFQPQGHHLLVTIKIDGKIRSDGHDAFVEAIELLRDLLPEGHRATLTHYKYEPGDATTGYKESSKAHVVFVVTKASLPQIVLNSSVQEAGKALLELDKAGQKLMDAKDTGPW